MTKVLAYLFVICLSVMNTVLLWTRGLGATVASWPWVIGCGTTALIVGLIGIRLQKDDD